VIGKTTLRAVKSQYIPVGQFCFLRYITFLMENVMTVSEFGLF